MKSSTCTPRRKAPPTSNDTRAVDLPFDWVLGQQIGILAYALSQLDVEAAKRKEGRDARRRCQLLLLKAIGKLESIHSSVGLLPLSSLHLLSRTELNDALPAELKLKQTEWTTLYKNVTSGRWESDGSPRPSQANAAKLIAHQILFTDARPVAIAAASHALLSRKFVAALNDPAQLEMLLAPLAILHNPTAHTSELLTAIIHLNSYFTRHSHAWNLVRNALFDHVLTWPILVFGNRNAPPIGAVSIPIMLDLSFDGRNNVIIRSDVAAKSLRTVDFNDWREHLLDASEKGKALWRAKNGNTGRWRDQVLNATTIFDFRVAERLMAGLGLRAIFLDKSMGPYYAQIVLSKAIGRHVGFTAAITGLIGEQRIVDRDLKRYFPPSSQMCAGAIDATKPDSTPSEELELPAVVEQEYVLDWRFSWAGKVTAKRRYIYGSYKFDRLVLPISKRRENNRDQLDELSSYVETNHCNYLSEVADCVQIGGWRQFRYIRCPDVMHTIHRYPSELLDAADSQVQRCQTLLRRNTSPFLSLPDDISVSHLFTALRDINFVKRYQDEHPAPTLSWAVVRTTDEELDTRFWHLIWRVLGAPKHLFNRFKLAKTPQKAAQHLAQALNCLEPDENDRGERAPDLLVVLGTHNLYLPEAGDFALVRPLAYEYVIDKLRAEHIAPVLSARLRDFIGLTRVITIKPKDERLGAYAQNTSNLRPLLKDILKRHSVYRFGFTQQMSSVIMRDTGLSPSDLRPALQDLCQLGIASYGSGWYRIRSFEHPGAKEFAIENNLDAARYHFSAALSFAPYMATWETPGLNIANAMLPENVREAIFHFEEAIRFASKARDSQTAQRARLAMQKLTRFFEINTWGVITRLSGYRSDMPVREVYEMAKELLAELERNRIEPLPTVLTSLARAATQWWIRIGGRHLSVSEPPERLREEIINTYERACRLTETNNAFFKLRLHVWTHYSVFLRLFEKSAGEVSRRAALNDAIEEHIEGDLDAIWPNVEWFEFSGDETYSHAASRKYYELGMKYHPGYAANGIKALGSVTLESGSGNVATYLSSFDRRTVDSMMKRIQVQYVNTLKNRRALDRWRAGQAFLRAHFQNASLPAHQIAETV
jgi:hypothetical protein